MSDKEKLIMVTGFLLGIKSQYPKSESSINEIMKMLNLDKIESDLKIEVDLKKGAVK